MCIFHLITGGEEGRPGWPSTDASRRRNSGPVTSSANLFKQKGLTTNDLPLSKDATVSSSNMHLLMIGCTAQVHLSIPCLYYRWI